MKAIVYLDDSKFCMASRDGRWWIGRWRRNVEAPWYSVMLNSNGVTKMSDLYALPLKLHATPLKAMKSARLQRMEMMKEIKRHGGSE